MKEGDAQFKSASPFIMKFNKLHIQNFQSHKDTVITFSSGLNIIIGPTDTGKSAILRALRKLIRDEPSGKAFISKWSKDMTITLTFERDTIEYTVCRRITPSKNLYSLDTEEYGGFGKTIPEEIQNTLDMALVELETGEELDLHFADQHEPPFMISKGQAGTRSKLLGRIAGLHVLDRAIMRVNSDIRAENSSLKHKDKERETLQYALEDWPDLWHELELIDTLAERIHTVKIDQTRYDKITKIHEKLLHIRDKAKEVPLPEIKADFEGIKDRIIHLNKLGEVFTKLTNIVKDASIIDEKLIISQLKECSQEHTSILKELGICPTCKKPIHGETSEAC